MRILLALDDSKYSVGATDSLIAQAKTEDAEVHVLHAVEPFPERLAEGMGSKGNHLTSSPPGWPAQAG